jgi:hypothetical protein
MGDPVSKLLSRQRKRRKEGVEVIAFAHGVISLILANFGALVLVTKMLGTNKPVPSVK